MDCRFSITFQVQKQQLLREAIADVGISKRALTAIKFDGGEIVVNGLEQNVRYMLMPNDVVTIRFPLEEASEGLIAQEGFLQIFYEDAYVLVINKPPYQSTIPSREHPNDSVANVVLMHLQKQQIASTVHVVTRLDRDTSGLLCIAKHRHIHHLLSEQQKKRCISRQYEAIVHGVVTAQSIIKPIGRKEDSIIEREVRADGQFAHTDVDVLSIFTVNDESYSYVRLTLHTGRTHQIRVHMAHIGHPLVGDDLYGGKRDLIARHALHCVSLSFEHPIRKERVLFTSELPEDMQRLLMNDSNKE